MIQPDKQRRIGGRALSQPPTGGWGIVAAGGFGHGGGREGELMLSTPSMFTSRNRTQPALIRLLFLRSAWGCWGEGIKIVGEEKDPRVKQKTCVLLRGGQGHPTYVFR